MSSVAALWGDWEAVVRTVNAVLKQPFVLLAEDGDPMKDLHFDSVESLSPEPKRPRGRAFDEAREVRWREINKGRFVVTYLSEDHPPPAELGFKSSEGNWETDDATQKLYGKWSNKLGDWVEVSVPGTRGKYHRLLSPEVHQCRPLQFDAVDYKLEGLVQFTRYRVVKPFEQQGGE